MGGDRLTLVVDHESVRMMAVRAGLVTAWGSTRLPPTLLRPDGTVTNVGELAERLVGLVEGQTVPRAARGRTVVAIPGNRLDSRLVPLGPLDPADSEAIGLRARELVPRDDAIHAWQVVGPPERAALFVAAAPSALIGGYVAALERAALRPVAIDVKPLALIRGVGQQQAILVDAEPGRGTIVLVDEALPRGVHFPLLAAPLLQASDDKVLRLTEALVDVVRAALSEGVPPALPVYLSGTLAEHPLLRAVVRDVLGHPIGVVRPRLELPPALPVAQFVANFGLATKRLD